MLHSRRIVPANWLAASLVVALAGGCAHGADAIATFRSDPRLLGDSYSRPAWTLPLQGGEVDILEPMGGGRILVGTLAARSTSLFSPYAQPPQHLLAVDAGTGTTIWTFDRTSLGAGPQRLLSLQDKVAVLKTERDQRWILAAVDLESGSKLWQQKMAEPQAFTQLEGGGLVTVHHTDSHLEVTQLRLLDGAEVWKVRLDGYPPSKEQEVQILAAGGDLLLSGPEIALLDGASGKVRWRVPFAGQYGAGAGVLTLADGLLASDAAGVSLLDRTSGATRWTHRPADETTGMLGQLASLVLVEGRSREAGATQIIALQSATGREVWRTRVEGRVSSPFLAWGETIVFTSPEEVVALRAADGGPVFRAPIPGPLRAANLLPDWLGVVSDRVVVARELGVMAVSAQGRVVFSHAISGAEAFASPYLVRRLELARHKLLGRERGGFRPAHVPMTSAAMQLAATQAEYDRSQPGTWSHSAAGARLLNETRMAQMEARINASLEFSAAMVGAAWAIGAAVWSTNCNDQLGNLGAALGVATLAHAASLDGGLYVRPFYREGQWLAIVDLASGRRRDLHLSPRITALDTSTVLLPAHAVEPGAGRLLATGIGDDVEGYRGYEARLIDPQQDRVLMTVPRPSLFAFDLATIPPVKEEGAGPAVRHPVSGKERALNDAVLARDPKRVADLLQGGADPNVIDENGLTPLMYAAALWEPEIVEQLLRAGADVARTDPRGGTAVTYAWLMQEGFTPASARRWGKTRMALEHAWAEWQKRQPPVQAAR